MRRKRITAVLAIITAILLTASILFYFSREEDPYQYYTGLGSTLSIAPDDSRFAFSFYEDGHASIYTAKTDGSDPVKVLQSIEEQTSEPRFAPDGKGMLFLKNYGGGIQTLEYMSDYEKGSSRQLTKKYLKVFTAAFSPDGNFIYFVATPVEDGMLPADVTEGTDIFMIGTDGNGLSRLTDNDVIPMSRLAVSPSDDKIYYTGFGESEGLYIYDLANEAHKRLKHKDSDNGLYDPAISRDGKRIVYTKVAETNGSKGVFQYELFLEDIKSGQQKQLTYDGMHASVPTFFHHTDKLAYMLQTNWPDEPAHFEVKTVRADGSGNETISVKMPDVPKVFHFGSVIESIVSIQLMAFLYVVMLILWTVYFLEYRKRLFLPAVASCIITAAVAVCAVIASIRDPFLGPSLVHYTGWLAGSSACILVAAFVMKWSRRNSSVQ